MNHQGKPRWLALILPIVLVLIALIAAWGTEGIRTQTRRDLKDELGTVLRTTQRALHIWQSDTQADASFWANFQAVRQAVERQVKRAESGRPLRGTPASDELNQLLTPLVQRQAFLGYFVVDLKGRQIAGTESEKIGRNAMKNIGPLAGNFPELERRAIVSLPFRLNDGLSGKSLDRSGLPTVVMTATAPVRDERGRTIAILGLYLDPRTGLGSTMQLGRIGQTGETYAFDRSGRLLTESRFDPDLRQLGWIKQTAPSTALALTLHDPGGNLLDGFRPSQPPERLPLTEMAQSATSGKSGNDVDGYRDYRGVEVVGAWLWDDELGLGLATELDIREAYSSFFITRRLVFFMLAVTMGSAALVFWVLWRQSSQLSLAVGRLERTRGQLQDALQSRNEFISIASHELKTPLTSLKMQLELLNRLALDGTLVRFPQDKLRRLTDVSAQEIGRLASLIQNLFDVSRIMSGRFPVEPEEIDLMELVQSAVSRMSPQFAQAGCPVTVTGPPGAVGCWDRSQIEQVVSNLLSNAIKYGARKPIEVEVHPSEERVSLRVRDHGVGIRPEDQQRIFERFERADRARQASGLGLGLYIVKKIVVEHGGSVRVESRFGRGSTFIVELPKNLRRPFVAQQPRTAA